MENEPKYEYRVSSVDDSTAQADKNMKQWADAGWELVSGSAASWASRKAGYVEETTWHTQYVMYWRKPVANMP